MVSAAASPGDIPASQALAAEHHRAVSEIARLTTENARTRAERDRAKHIVHSVTRMLDRAEFEHATVVPITTLRQVIRRAKARREFGHYPPVDEPGAEVAPIASPERE